MSPRGIFTHVGIYIAYIGYIGLFRTGYAGFVIG